MVLCSIFGESTFFGKRPNRRWDSLCALLATECTPYRIISCSYMPGGPENIEWSSHMEPQLCVTAPGRVVAGMMLLPANL